MSMCSFDVDVLVPATVTAGTFPNTTSELFRSGAPVANLQISTDAPGWYHPGRSACARLGPTVLAQFGELHPRIARAMEADGPIAAFEVFLDNEPPVRKKAGAAKPLLALSAFQHLAAQ